MSTLATALYGCLGGAMAYVAIFALPQLRAAKVNHDFRPRLWPTVQVVLIAASQIALGGAVAVWIGDASVAKQAISYGIAAEGMVAGVAKNAKPGL